MLSLFYIPYPDKKSAEEMSFTLLEKNLVACAHICEGESIFTWHEELRVDEDVVLLLKTTSEKSGEIFEFIEKEHPYEIPAIIEMPFKTNKIFEQWMRKQVQ